LRQKLATAAVPGAKRFYCPFKAILTRTPRAQQRGGFNRTGCRLGAFLKWLNILVRRDEQRRTHSEQRKLSMRWQTLIFSTDPARRRWTAARAWF